MNYKFLNRIFGGLSLFLIWFFLYFFLQGFTELIKNQTAGVITFYGLIAVLIILKVTDFLCLSLLMILKGEIN